MVVRTLYLTPGDTIIEVDVWYNIIPGEEATELTPKIDDDIEIIDIEILAVVFWDDINLGKKWFKYHPDWEQWLKDRLYNHITDCENCIEELLDA